jgi:hypothetical protein
MTLEDHRPGVEQSVREQINMGDDIWIDKETVLKGVVQPNSPKPEGRWPFVVNLLSSLFTHFGFEIPFPAPTLDLKWWLDSAILDFISDVIVTTGMPMFEEIMHAFFKWSFDNQQKVGSLAPGLLHSILRKIDQSNAFDLLIDYLSLFTGFFSLADVALLLIDDLFNVIETIKKRKKSSSVHRILLVLFRSVPASCYSDLFDLFCKYMDSYLFLVQGSVHCWLYVFLTSCSSCVRTASFVQFKATLGLKLTGMDAQIVTKFRDGKLSTDFPTLSLLEQAWKTEWNEFQSTFLLALEDMKRKKSVCEDEWERMSKDQCRSKFFFNLMHYLFGHLLGNSLRVVVTIREFDNETQNWQIVVNLLKDRVINDYLLNPPSKAAANPSTEDVGPIEPRTMNDLTRVGIDRKQFQICPRAFPFIPPSLMTKMISLSLNISKVFKTYAKFIYSRSISFRTNLLDIFKKSCLPQTRLLESFRCELCRYSFKTPSVVFLFQDSFYIVTTTTLTQDRSDFQFDGLVAVLH